MPGSALGCPAVGVCDGPNCVPPNPHAEPCPGDRIWTSGGVMRARCGWGPRASSRPEEAGCGPSGGGGP